ncbi:hypothetical protein [Thermogymnomonas acidicola]|uniref:hypothetical protein n=1 Tax=Thermogymnomonas acidicola TaxID=399579 RepID=UPI0009468447|nr:hypothetical protein [Thermogymnomonas acidicola]
MRTAAGLAVFFIVLALSLAALIIAIISPQQAIAVLTIAMLSLIFVIHPALRNFRASPIEHSALPVRVKRGGGGGEQADDIDIFSGYASRVPWFLYIVCAIIIAAAIVIIVR